MIVPMKRMKHIQGIKTTQKCTVYKVARNAILIGLRGLKLTMMY
jgi:hypothetical protein